MAEQVTRWKSATGDLFETREEAERADRISTDLRDLSNVLEHGDLSHIYSDDMRKWLVDNAALVRRVIAPANAPVLKVGKTAPATSDGWPTEYTLDKVMPMGLTDLKVVCGYDKAVFDYICSLIALDPSGV